MSSRWGPPVAGGNNNNNNHPSTPPKSCSATPDSPGVIPTTTTGAINDDNNNNDNVLEEPVADYDTFEVIEEVEWGPRKGEEGYDTDQELAPRPRRKAITENCGCLPPPEGWSCLDDSCVLYACREECRSNCEAGHVCGNKRLTRKEFWDVEVFDAGNKGKGLRLSTRPTTKKAVFGDIITEYTGRAIRKEALNRLFRRYQFDRRLYIMALGDEVYLDARHKGGLARYINHSCSPNCKVELWTVKGIMRAAVVALRDIEPGEELTFDYQWERKRGRAPTKCHCGVPECRGTIEISKSMEEQDLERELDGHWESQQGSAGQTLVNRTVKIFNEESNEYYLGEVTGYDADKKLHSILYRQDMNEAWEDLQKTKWMVLNEKVDKEHFIISKKRQKRRPSPVGSLVRETGSVRKPVLAKNYLFVQTPIKEALWAMHLVERCERNCNVQIQADQMARPPLPPNPNDPEDMEKYSALDKSNDGTVWKLTITGSDVLKACNILQKNVAFVEKKHASEAASSASKTPNTIIEPEGMMVPSQSDAHEVIFPRIIADAVKRKLQSVRDKCRSVNITFVASESKSKQFSKLILEGSLLSDIEAAKQHLWGFFLNLCKEADAPMTPNKIPRHLGFLGGTLSSDQFLLLYKSTSAFIDLTESSADDRKTLSIDASEDLNLSSFIRSFETNNNCTVWVQALEDQGRIDSKNRVVSEALPNGPRKIFFGCKPSDVARLAASIQGRVNELARGVKYIHLGADRVYMKFMMRNGGLFFDYVKQVTGATVTVDPMTGDHLRTDGRVPPSANQILEDSVKNMSEAERASLANEIIRLQVECYRDECIREDSWMFGRDWTLSNFALSAKETDTRATTTSIGQLDRRNVGYCSMELAETVARLELTGATAAHAIIILYRFANAMPEFSTQIKAREALLACVFLASKAEKAGKRRRLEAVLKAGYETFYPGSKFDPSSEEASVLEERVIAAEKEILSTVQYDIFWKGTGWIKLAATHAGKMSKPHVARAFAFSFSGPVLGAGAELWLKYGVEYIFAVASAFLKADLEDLLPALNLIPLKVSQAAKLLVESARYGRAASFEKCSHPLLESEKEHLEKYLPKIEQTCVEIMARGKSISLVASAAEHRYRIIGRQSRQYRAVRGIPREVIEHSILPVIEGIAAESSCRFYFADSGVPYADDLILDGPWRAIAIAYHLVREKLHGGIFHLPPLVDISPESRDRPNEHAKVYAGFLKTHDIFTGEGWKGTIQAENKDDASGRRVGGKCCVPSKISESSLRRAGLRWWVPPAHGPSQSGSIPEMVAMRSDPAHQLSHLVDLARSVAVDPLAFPILTSRAARESKPAAERFMPVSIQRWPPSKVAAKEKAKLKASDTEPMQTGFSAAALQEMQLLKQLHSVIPSNQGHPNFIVPVGVAFPAENGNSGNPVPDDRGDLSPDDPIFSLFRSNDDNAKAEKIKKQVTDGAHIVFQPTPFVLQRFLSRKHRGSENTLISPCILAAWFHDILSALVHCHTNHIVLRTILPDQIVVDQSGIAKIGAMYRSTALTSEERRHPPNPRKLAQEARKERKKKDDDEDFSGNPYAAPEILLGCPKHSKESDVWAAGCLLANLLLNKPLFIGKDRNALLSSQYKVVGTPSRESNYPEALKFPDFTKPLRKYKRGVEKALEHLLKEKAAEHQGAISLIARMLHLDPAERCTAAEALGHDYITDFVEKSATEEFRQQYVSDWLQLKAHMLQASEDEKLSRKRTMIMAASKSEGCQDDLYDMEDLLPSFTPKKAKSGFL